MSSFVTNTSHKSRKTALLLCIFLGWCGAHRFYVGKYKSGYLYILTIGVFMMGWIHDLKAIILGDFTDRQGNVLIEW